MALPSHIFTPAFRHRRLGWFFAALVGIMVYLATFATATEAALSIITFTWDKGMESRLTVEIPAVDDESSVAQPERVRQVLAVLHAMPDVANAVAVPDDETLRLLKPWIGQPELLRQLPVPTLVDVERKSGGDLTAEDIQSRLKGIASDVRVDDHAAWLEDLANLVRGLSIMAGLIVLLTGVTLVITVSLLCRAVMATEHEAISLLHVMGAADEDIARHFQTHARRIAEMASFSGFILGLGSAGLLLSLLRRFVDLSAPPPAHWFALGLTVLAVPLAATAIAAFSARLSVMRSLHGMP